jgi:16S rRNA (guanine1207-N2)-methyltransferase
MLHPGGRLYFVGATREGVKSAIGAARDLFGRVGVLERKGGYHAALARRPDGPWPKPQVDYAQVEVEVEGTPTLLVGVPGVFAFDRVDEGATSLIGAMQVREGEATLDLGCGTGLVGLAALRRGGEVTLADVSARAVESARRTLASNGYPEAPVRLSVGASAFADATFDVVVTNPPFHKGHGVDFEVARLFIVGAARVLRPGGRLYLVANAFLPYEPWLQERFREVRVAWESPRFKVWRGTK